MSGVGGGWPGSEEHRKSGCILKMELPGFAMDRIWDVGKSKGGVAKGLGLKSGTIRTRHNTCPPRAHSVTRALVRGGACWGARGLREVLQDSSQEPRGSWKVVQAALGVRSRAWPGWPGGEDVPDSEPKEGHGAPGMVAGQGRRWPPVTVPPAPSSLDRVPWLEKPTGCLSLSSAAVANDT